MEDFDCQNFEDYCNSDFEDRLYYNFNDILKTWSSVTLRNPGLFIRSYLNVTSPIWEIKINSNEFNSYYYNDYNADEENKPNLKLRSLFEKYSDYLNILFISSGKGLFLIIVSLFVLIKKSRLSLKKLLPFVPVLSNAIVIMLLITGEEYRLV